MSERRRSLEEEVRLTSRASRSPRIQCSYGCASPSRRRIRSGQRVASGRSSHTIVSAWSISHVRACRCSCRPTTQPSSPPSASSTLARSSSAVASCQFGPWWSASARCAGRREPPRARRPRLSSRSSDEPITAIRRLHALPYRCFGGSSLVLGLALAAAAARRARPGWRPNAARRASARPRRLPGYAEAGGDDPRVNWVQPFVQKTGCKVHVRTVRSSTELLDAVATGATTALPPSAT